MTILVFPGQGSQYLGMAKDFHDNFKIAKEVFELVEDCSKIKIRDIIFDNKDDLLNITEYTQICIFTASISIFKVFNEIFLKTNLVDIDYTLGHSLGEYSALTAAGVINIEDCSRLLKIRGKLMQNADPTNTSGMAAVLGLDSKTIENVILNNSIDIEVANDNSQTQVVLSGKINNLKNSEEIFIKNGAKKFVYLNVSSAFHSKIMINAENAMKESLNKINFSNPSYSVISNFNAKPSKDKFDIIDNLSKQISNKVRWFESMKYLEKNKNKKIIEFGPGKVLSGLNKRILKDFFHLNFNEVKDIKNIENEI